jgi:hypothetical protein
MLLESFERSEVDWTLLVTVIGWIVVGIIQWLLFLMKKKAEERRLKLEVLFPIRVGKLEEIQEWIRKGMELYNGYLSNELSYKDIEKVLERGMKKTNEFEEMMGKEGYLEEEELKKRKEKKYIVVYDLYSKKKLELVKEMSDWGKSVEYEELSEIGKTYISLNERIEKIYDEIVNGG